jgi:hypothetical protein
MPQESAAPVVLTAACAYAAFTLAGLALHGWDPLWFVWIGERFANLEPGARTGYDGQFIYYFARDGWAAVPHLDNPPYRLQRVLYALLARWLSGGQPAALPWAMVAINFAAIVVTTLLATHWLIAQRVWRWYGLVYPFFVGTMMAYSRDLTEPLTCALGLAGVLRWLSARRALAIVMLALAALARETAVLFAVGLAICELTERRVARAMALAATFIPLLLWELYLRAQLGSAGLASAEMMKFVPCADMFTNLSLEPGRVSALIFVALPALALGPAVVRLVVAAPRDPIAWLVAVHWAFLLYAPSGAHLHVLALSRQSAALVMMLLLAFPRWSPAVRRAIAVGAIAPTLLWLGPVLWWAPWTAKL